MIAACSSAPSCWTYAMVRRVSRHYDATDMKHDGQLQLLPARTLKDWYLTKMSPSSVKQNSRRWKNVLSACGCLLSAHHSRGQIRPPPEISTVKLMSGLAQGAHHCRKPSTG